MRRVRLSSYFGAAKSLLDTYCTSPVFFVPAPEPPGSKKDLSEVLRGLDAKSETLLRLLGMIFPEPVGLIQWGYYSGVFSQDSWFSPTPKDQEKSIGTVDGAIRRKFVEFQKAGGGRFRLSPDFGIPVPVLNRNTALNPKRLSSLVKAFPGQFCRISYDPDGIDLVDPARYPALVRSALYGERSERLEEILDIIRSRSRGHSGVPILLDEVFSAEDPDWFDALPVALQVLILETLLRSSLEQGVPSLPFRTRFDRFLGTAAKRVLRPEERLRIANLVTLSRHLLEGYPQDERIRPLLPPESLPVPLILSAKDSFLDGEFSNAALGFDRATREYRKTTGIRNLPLHSPFLGLHHLSRMLSTTGEEAEKAFRSMEKLVWNLPAPERPICHALLEVWTFLHRLPEKELKGIAFRIPPESGIFSVWFMMLAGLVREEPFPDGMDRRIGETARLLRERGWGFSALLFDALADLRNGKTQAHFLSPLAPVPPWKRTLTILEREFGEKQESGESSGTLPGARYFWGIRESGSSSWMAVHVEFLEQKRLKSGQWGKVSAVSEARLRTAEKSLSLTQRGDQELLEVLLKKRRNMFYERVSSSEAIQFMMRLSKSDTSPTVAMDFKMNPLEISVVHPEIRVRRIDGQLQVDVHPVPDQEGNLPPYAEWDLKSGIRILEATTEQRQIARLIREGIGIPSGGEDQVRRVLNSLSRTVSVHSDLPLDGEPSEELPPDDRLRIQIAPDGTGGYRLAFRVRPLGNAGRTFSPGSGPETVYGRVEHQPVLTRRLLNKERDRANDVLKLFPDLEENGEPDSFSFDLSDPLTLLELLERIPTMEETPVIEWPEGASIKIRSAAPGGFNLQPVRRPGGFWLEGGLDPGDGEILPLERIMELWKSRNGRFIPLEGGAFLALSQALTKQIQEFEIHLRQEAGKMVLDDCSAGFLGTGCAAEAVIGTAEWVARIERFKKALDQEPVVPRTLQAILRPYQEEGFRWMARLAAWGAGGCLADDMGLGKTVQILALLLSRSAQGPSLVVAPASVVGNWMREAHRFAPDLGVRSLFEGDREKIVEDAGPGSLVVASYGLMVQEIERLSAIDWNVVVLDESQSIKNADTLRARSAFRLKGDVRVAASGTPIENHLTELWSLFSFLNPGYLGSQESFREQVVVPVEERKDAAIRLRLRKRIQPFILRRLKSQVLEELPPKTEITLPVPLTLEERALYETIREEALKKMADEESRASRSMFLLASLTRLRRAACHPRLVLPHADFPGSKTQVFLDLVVELLENGHRALVFSAFVDHLSILKEALSGKGISYLYLDGSTRESDRRGLVDRFQSGEGSLFLISLKAGGTGLNLTGADYVIHMDPWWNPAALDQATDRAHRIGQERPVTVYRLVAEKTIEERILALHQTKRELADALLEGTDTAVVLNLEAMMTLLNED